MGHFSRALFEFLDQLKANNNREWFAANRSRYIAAVEEPTLRFIDDLRKPLRARVSRHFIVDPRRVGGSMLRIYRDTRFSKDKTPFTPSARAIFWHEARAGDQAVPGFYLQLGPDQCLAGGGIPRPDATSLKRIRDRMVDKPGEWAAVLRAKIRIEGHALKRPPAGYDPEHRFVEDLKRKKFLWTMTLTAREVRSTNFLDRYVDACGRLAPAVAFLTKSLGLGW